MSNESNDLEVGELSAIMLTVVEELANHSEAIKGLDEGFDLVRDSLSMAIQTVLLMTASFAGHLVEQHGMSRDEITRVMASSTSDVDDMLETYKKMLERSGASTESSKEEA